MPLPRTEPPVPGDHDLAATLKALAANSSSFGGDQAGQGGGFDPNDIDPEMLARLAEYPLHQLVQRSVVAQVIGEACWWQKLWLPL